MSNWRDNLKVGDTVVVHNRQYDRLKQVTKVTQTFVFVDYVKFSKKSGEKTGLYDLYSRESLQQATEEKIKYLTLQQEKRSLGISIRLELDSLERVHKNFDVFEIQQLTSILDSLQTLTDFVNAIGAKCGKDL